MRPAAQRYYIDFLAPAAHKPDTALPAARSLVRPKHPDFGHPDTRALGRDIPRLLEEADTGLTSNLVGQVWNSADLGGPRVGLTFGVVGLVRNLALRVLDLAGPFVRSAGLWEDLADQDASSSAVRVHRG